MDTECPICLELITPLSDKILLVSEICDHKICDVCAEKQLASQGSYTQCAICRSHITRFSFVPYDMSSTYYENHKEARKRVLHVYNDTRNNFKDTPDYNKYLEDRESIIFELTNCKDESRLKAIEHELRTYERNNSLKISKNIENKKAEHKKMVQSIVEKEKTFYEIVDKGAPFNLWKPLKKLCPNYFTEETTVITRTESKPLNAAIRNDSDIPRRVYTTRIELMESDVAGGYSKNFSETDQGLDTLMKEIDDMEREIELVIPDFIEIEPKKTKMYKILAENYCYKSPEYNLSWKVSPCKVDLIVKSPYLERKDNRSENYIKHEATLHTLKYVNREDNINKFEDNVSYNYSPKVDNYYVSEDRNSEYKPPEIYNIDSETESTKSSENLNRINNIEELRHYIQNYMV